MPSGIEMLIAAAVKNLPPAIQDTIANVGQISIDVRNQMSRIENDLKLIKAHLGIEAGQDNGLDNAGNSGGGTTEIQKRN